MKKFLTLCLVLLVCIIGGCSDKHYDDEAIQLYLDAAQQEKNMESMHLEMKGFLYEDAKKEQMSGKANFDCEMILTGPLQVAMNISFAYSGVLIDDIHFYIKDETIYFDAFEEKIKIPFPEEFAALEPILSYLTENITIDADTVKKNFKDLKFADKEKGIIAFTFNLDAFNKLSDADESANIKDMIKSYTGTMTIQDQMVKELTLDLLLDIEWTQYPVSVTLTCTEVNEINKIKFPDFKDYKLQEVDDEL